YQEGDDLRRIHWPSVARSGELMIRQDESSRRASAVLFLDTRESALGKVRTPAFERGVSAAASVGVLLARSGFSTTLATSQMAPMPVTEERLLETLAGIGHHTSRALSAGLTSLIRSGVVFGPKIAILVYPVDPETLPPERQAHLEGRATSARLSLSRSGWEVLIVSPSGRLRDVWQRTRNRSIALSI